MKLLIVLFVLIISAASIKADPLTFTNVVAIQNGNQTVDLFSNPNTILFGPNITFTATINGSLPSGGSDPLAITFRDGNGNVINSQVVAIPLLGVIPPPVSVVFSFNAPTVSFAGTPYTLTLNLLNSTSDFPQAGVDSYTFSFKAAQPVSEPTALLMFASASSSLLLLKKRKRTK